MAEMIFKDLIIKNNKRYMMSCVSRATSIEEIGNDIYPQAKRKLVQMGVTCESHRATQVTKSDYDKYDYIIVMEERNKRDLLRIIGEDKDNKIHLLLEYTDNIKDIDDPWYSGDFDTAFNEINEGCIGLFNYLVNLGDNNEI
jgi:protein-tyrosine phosphatase